MSAIEWTDVTWNPVRGCSRVSEGCRNCYAERMAARFSTHSRLSDQILGRFHGFAKMTPAGPRWTVHVELIPSKLDEPLRWKKPRRVFVNSMSDLFHEALSDDAIADVFTIMAAARQHTFQVLTKRPAGMLAWMRRADEHMRQAGILPAPTIWLGVSAEDQATADERIPLLLQTPAALRFVSYEPALGPVDFSRWLGRSMSCGKHGRVPVTKWMTTKQCGYCLDEGMFPPTSMGRDVEDGLDWVIVGGESGPGARPFDLAWARSVVRQCREAGVACFVKQLGAKPYDSTVVHLPPPELLFMKHSKGGDPAEWPEDLRVREFPVGRP